MTLSDIKNSIYRRTNTDSNDFPAADMLIAINKAYNRVGSLILLADSRWQWDDYNQTDLPIATTTVTSGQQDYTLASAHLTIDRVEIKDSAGNWHELDQIDQQLLKRDRKIALAEYQGTSGLPQEYDVVGNSVFLYPTPNYTLAAALKVYFTRGPSEFTSSQLSTGTATPGFASIFHDLIPLWVSYDYATENGLRSASGLFADIQRQEDAIEKFYGLRNRDYRAGFRITTDSNK